MNTNAFRSSTDKEWTRFRGSDVSGLYFFLYFFLFFFFLTFASLALVSRAQVCVKYEWRYGPVESLARDSNGRNRTRNCGSYNQICPFHSINPKICKFLKRGERRSCGRLSWADASSSWSCFKCTVCIFFCLCDGTRSHCGQLGAVWPNMRAMCATAEHAASVRSVNEPIGSNYGSCSQHTSEEKSLWMT